jgi:phospholipid/cholesterol/gamma-HCH transport system substrate-binding protein
VNVDDDRRKAGAFVLVALGLLLLLMVILAGVRFLSRDRTYFAEFFESVSGLEPSSPVKYKGVPVGSVTQIDFDPDDLRRILVKFKVRPDVPMKKGTRAVLQPMGITGISYLELSADIAGAEDLDPAEAIPSDPGFSAKVQSSIKDLSELIARLNAFVAKNEENLTYAITDFRASAGSIRSTLEKVDAMIARAGGIFDEGSAVVGEGRKAVEDIRRAIADVGAEVKSTGESVRRAVGALEETLRDPELRGLAGKASKTLDQVNDKVASADLKGLVDRVNLAVDEFRRIEESLDRAASALALTAEDGRRDVGAALADIRAAAGHVREATRLLKEDPGRLLRGRPEAEKPVPDPMPPLPEDHQ